MDNRDNTRQGLPVFELYFAPLMVSLNPTDFEKVTFAYLVSKFGHGEQTRKDQKTRYFEHPKGANWTYMHEFGGRNVRVMCDTLLHDMGEDSYLLSLYRVQMNFGEDIALDMRALTKLPDGKETLEEYLARVCARGPETITAKLLDSLDNARDADALTAEEKKKLARKVEDVYLPALIPALKAHGGEWAELADKFSAKFKLALAALKQ